ncbi:MAG TPA: sulfotransferase [Actinobacteria bacterium]|nr:sulfotransferase domain protein [bacterium BMS3Bbin01]HDH24808.1 sulfotransferase [Actinomycetota bacterium]
MTLVLLTRGRRGYAGAMTRSAIQDTAASRPILVTGSHRSGTTWVGRMLALPSGVGYIHEPFNPLTVPPIGPLVDGFTFVHEGNEHLFRPALEQVLRYRWHRRLHHINGPKDATRLAAERFEALRSRIRGARPLMKDPMAILSAEWLAATFAMEIVVTVRHPAAFAVSLRRLSWRYDFSSLLSQRELMERLLAPYEDLLRQQERRPGDIIGEAAVLWLIIHHVIDGYRRRHPDWSVVRHEDLSADPIGGFARLYESLGLAFRPRIESKIRAVTGSGNPTEPKRDPVHGVRRDSRAIARRWRNELSNEEVARIRELTGPVAAKFYAEDEW